MKKEEENKTTKKVEKKEPEKKNDEVKKAETKEIKEETKKVEKTKSVKDEKKAETEKTEKAEKVEVVKEDKKAKKTEKAAKKLEKKKGEKKEKKTEKIVMIATIVAIILVISFITAIVVSVVRNVTYVSTNPVATIEVKNFGTIKVELYPEYAPNTVSNFIKLANGGFYNGLTFHRTIPDFMIQGGDKNGDGSGNATLKDIGKDSDKSYAIKGEFILNGFTQNTLKHKRGVISMARSDYSSQGTTTLTKKGYDSASSQFFIMTADNTSLDGNYASFGEVKEGMDVVDAISKVEVQTRDSNSTNSDLVADKPVNPPVIKSVTVDTKGVDYGDPETVEPFDYYSYMMQQYYSGNKSN